MQHYFILQFKLLKRRISDFGIPPYLGFILGAIGFVIVSFVLFEKTQFASYIYAFLGLSSVYKLGEIKRNDFLKQLFSTRKYRQVRAIENSFLIVPFVMFLFLKAEWVIGVLLIIVSLLSSLIDRKERFFVTIPTPFGRWPFEFTIGFRKTFWVFGVIAFIVLMAIKVDNFNLGAFALLLIFIVTMSFYGMSEQEYFVWIHQDSAKEFLQKKIKIAIGYASILSIPVFIVLCTFFPQNYLYIIGVQIIGYLYLLTMVVAKYSAYPNNISLPHAFFFGLSLWLPPLLLIIIPFFYFRAIRQLERILI